MENIDLIIIKIKEYAHKHNIMTAAKDSYLAADINNELEEILEQIKTTIKLIENEAVISTLKDAIKTIGDK